MDLLERVVLFAVGGALGFILGFMVARLRAIEAKVEAVQNEVHEVDVIVKHDHKDRGSMRPPRLSSIALALVVFLTAFSAFSAAKTNGNLEKTVSCLTRFNADQNKALSARDSAIKMSSDSEIALWTLYESLYAEADDLAPEATRLEELQDRLYREIVQYRDSLIRTQKIRDRYEYGEPNILKNCKEKQDG